MNTSKREILEQWATVAESYESGVEFDLIQHDRTDVLSERTDEFIENPSEQTFSRMWGMLHSATRGARPGKIWDKWDDSPEELADLFREIRDAEAYDEEWERQLGAEKSLWEFFGWQHIEQFPVLNWSTIRGLEFFGYTKPQTYTQGVEEFRKFRETYEDIVGRATEGTGHEAPINIEIDQLFNVIDKADTSSIEKETHEEVVELYELVLTAEGELTDDGTESTVPTVWVEKTKVDGREYKQSGDLAMGRALIAPSRDEAGRKRYETLRDADVGDLVVHLRQDTDEIVGISRIAAELEEDFEGPPDNRWAEEQVRRGGYLRRLEDFREFSNPIAIYDQVLDNDQYQERLARIRRDNEKIVYDKNHQLNQGHYFTECPKEFVHILAQESSELTDVLEEHGYDLDDIETGTGEEEGGGKTDSERLDSPESPPGEATNIERQLLKAKQLVFYGPPGTGKTYTAQQFARWWVNQQDGVTPTTEQVQVITFHPSFSYEDFIEGLTARSNEAGVVEYRTEPGSFKQICDAARQDFVDARESDDDDPVPRYVLIIDEINRGNLSQIFGETITLLEADKRLGKPNETAVRLAHSSDRFTIPPNLYVIGTMNTADRSIALVDAALRRRFRFLSFPPDYEVLYEHHGFEGAEAVEETAESATDQHRRLVALSVLALETLNEAIVDTPDLGKGKQLGHSYLMDVPDEEALVDAWKFEILPLLEEYYFGQFDRIREELFQGGGGRLFDWQREQITDFTARDLGQTFAELIDIPVEFADSEESETSDEGWVQTLNLLLDNGVLEPGDELVFNESEVPADATQRFDATDPFWRCEVTGKTGQSDNIRWQYNDEEYSFSGLAETILREVSDWSQPVSGPEYWRHPEYDDRLIRELRAEVQSGTLDATRETVD